MWKILSFFKNLKSGKFYTFLPSGYRCVSYMPLLKGKVTWNFVQIIPPLDLKKYLLMKLIFLYLFIAQKEYQLRVDGLKTKHL